MEHPSTQRLRIAIERELAMWQGRLNLAARDPRFKSLSVVALFEGNDGAGQGEAIRRVTGALDARGYASIVVAAPTDERFKTTEEDWRYREKWDAYETAVCDMVDHTSTHSTPWTLVEANNKDFARVKVLQTLCEAIEQALARYGKKGSKKK